ncbi:MAG: hypothetical protein NTW87_11710 [Planctomycetota bacterium]|nr:hypothetical protein [Planctomycetota bacterium]
MVLPVIAALLASVLQQNHSHSGRLLAATDQGGIGTACTYTNHGAVATVTDDRGKVTTNIYDEATGWLKAVRYPDGKGVVYTYDLNGNIATATYASAVSSTGEISTDQYEWGPGLRPQTYTYRYDEGNRVIQEWDPLNHLTTREYDTAGRLYKVTDPDGRSITTSYDGAGRTDSTVADPGRLVTKYAYDPKGPLASVRYPDGRTVAYTYDDLGRKKKETRTGEGTTIFKYDERHDLKFATDALKNVAEYFYDDAHRLVQTTLPGGRTSARNYDRAGFLKRMRDQKGQEFAFTNRDNGQRGKLWMGEENGGGLLGTWSYEGNTPTSDGALSWGLDDAGRVASCGWAAYAYGNPLGLLTRTSYGGVNLDYGYDDAGRMASITDGTNSLTYTERTPGGLPKAAQYGNGITRTWGYDANWNLNKLAYKKDTETLAEFSVLNDAYGRRRALDIVPTNEHFVYDYDAASRLKQELRTLDGVPTNTEYKYDAVGNRTEKHINGDLQEKYVYSDRYQLSEIQDALGLKRVGFEYDLNGNTKKKQVFAGGGAGVASRSAGAGSRALPGGPLESEITYEWDELNRLTTATRTVGAPTEATFTYAGTMGWQMTSQTVNGETRNFNWGYGGELLCETIPNVGARTYVNAGVDQVLWSKDNGGAKFWLNGANGSVFGITDSVGSVTERQRFDAFGNTQATDPGGAPAPSPSGNRLGFQGRTNIGELGIQYFRNRFYDPQIGRFLSRDPLGLVDGPAVYSAFGGNPVGNVDPMGTEWVWNAAINDYEWIARPGEFGYGSGPMGQFLAWWKRPAKPGQAPAASAGGGNAATSLIWLNRNPGHAAGIALGTLGNIAVETKNLFYNGIFSVATLMGTGERADLGQTQAFFTAGNTSQALTAIERQRASGVSEASIRWGVFSETAAAPYFSGRRMVGAFYSGNPQGAVEQGTIFALTAAPAATLPFAKGSPAVAFVRRAGSAFVEEIRAAGQAMTREGVPGVSMTAVGDQGVFGFFEGDVVHPNLAPYAGAEARGILDIVGYDVSLESTFSGNVAVDLLKSPRPGMNLVTLSHVEAQAAAILRLTNIQEAVLYINRRPCSPVGGQGCMQLLPKMLPKGKQLRVIGPDFDETFVGTGPQ